MLKIHESVKSDGSVAEVLVAHEGGGTLCLHLSDLDSPLALPEGALDAVMKKFGAPLEERERLAEIASLDLGDGRSLRHVRHLARYDVIARDYLVYERPGEDALCAMATTVAGALEHLGRAALGGA